MGAKDWKFVGQYQENDIVEIARRFALPKPIAVFLAARGVQPEQVPAFLNPTLENLSDPYRFPGIKDAARRLWEAILNREEILIHGDYDTDGITASALLALVLRNNGAIVHSFIPHRFDDGYGFTPESLAKALAAAPASKVLVTVDCGITSCDAVKKAISLGIDVIITDHHEAGPERPEAIAVINPKIYPELEDLHLLSGAGVAFKLAHAFVQYGCENNLGGFQTRLDEVLDYVALGTVADIVPLLGENRIMVKHGIEILRKQLRPGIRALIESSRLRGDLSPSDITFKLAPRINAAGRVGDSNVALHLLESENIVEAYHFAAELENYNRTRQDKEQEIYREACSQISKKLAWQSDYALLVAGRDWHQGVIGIVASRLARDCNRPTIVLTIQGEEAYGSGRSVSNLNLVEVLGKASPLLDRFGGHPMAVGIGLKADRIADFFEVMEAEIRRQLTMDQLKNFVPYDGDLTIADLTPDVFHCLNSLAPFGHSNTKPVFRFNNVEFPRTHAAGETHARGIVRDATGQIEFIAFNRSPLALRGRRFDILASPQLNTRYNADSMQLNLVDLKELD
ncbi:MAG: single-stranded-DNA-specific exonuclease RecJ [Lentisphaeria bacterium]|nr:single-stranded-DNA-specific exonuclease RecJ [Lentisphaeria bacterium]